MNALSFDTTAENDPKNFCESAGRPDNPTACQITDNHSVALFYYYYDYFRL